jgi:copper oxidase (laccase) domain-containing protein
MRQVFGCDPANILAATGPGIRACCFEVGPEVAALFEREFPGVPLARPSDRDPGKYCLDLNRALENQLSCAGVQLENCFDLGACTCCRTDEFFSYRAEGPASGRMMAVISFLKQG